MSVRSWIMVVLWLARKWVLERLCALVLEHSERLRLQTYMWKQENCPLNYDVNNCVYNISVNFDQFHATLLSVAFNSVFGTGFRRLFEARPNTIPTLGITLNQLVVDSELDLNSIAINSTPYTSLHGCWNLLDFSCPCTYLETNWRFLPLFTNQNSTNFSLNMMVILAFLLMDQRVERL